MNNKVALVTGVNGGIGQAICKKFKSEGYFVIGTDLDPENKAKVDSYFSFDLSRMLLEDQGPEVKDNVLKALPGDSIDVIVNNAAIQKLGGLQDLSLQDWQQSLSVNLFASVQFVKSLQSELVRGDSAVVNIGSIHSQLTKKNFVAYATTKYALEGLTRSLAVDMGSKVRFNCVCPAATRTPMLEGGFVGAPEKLAELESYHPVGKINSPEDVANLVYFLGSDQSKMINGSVVNIDGGIGCRLHDPD